MKKILFVSLFVLCFSFLASCEKKKDPEIEPSVRLNVTEEEWNKTVKDYAFTKEEKSNIKISIYTDLSINSEPDYTIYKNGLVYEFDTIVNGNKYINYGDFKNHIGYRYYGLEHNYFYKSDLKETIEENFSDLVENFSANFSDVVFKDGKYVSTIPYEGKEKYAYYSFNDGFLKEFSIVFEDEVILKMTMESTEYIINLPNVNYINEMPPVEMKNYLNECLKELRSYNAINADYKVEAYDHYTFASFEYLRVKKSDDTYKNLEEILADVKKLTIDSYFSKRTSVIGQVESVDENMWFGVFEEGNENGFVIKIVPRDEKINVLFVVAEQDMLEVLFLKEYLENRLVNDVEEDAFTFNGKNMIDTKDCFLIQYETEKDGEYETVLNYALTCVKDNGYEWVGSESSSDYRIESLEKDNIAVQLYFTSAGANCQKIIITFCISYTDSEPATIARFGIESLLFE